MPDDARGIPTPPSRAEVLQVVSLRKVTRPLGGAADSQAKRHGGKHPPEDLLNTNVLCIPPASLRV